MGSHIRKISKRQMIFSAFLLTAFAIIVILSLILEGKSYYYFVSNTPLGTLLYLAVVFRYMGEAKAAIGLDIAYLIVFVCLICSVAMSLKKPKVINIVYVVCACDILLCLLCKNFVGIVGDILIIVLAVLSGQGTVLREPF